MSNSNSSALKKYFHKNGRAMGSMGYFLILMLVFLIGAPEAWIRPNLHQSVFVMMPTLIFMVIPLVFLVTSGEIDISFATHIINTFLPFIRLIIKPSQKLKQH